MINDENKPSPAEWLKMHPNKGINDYYAIYKIEDSVVESSNLSENNFAVQKKKRTLLPYIFSLILVILVIGYLAYNSQTQSFNFRKLFSGKVEIKGKFSCSKQINSQHRSDKSFETQLVNSMVKEIGDNCLFQVFIFSGKSTVMIQSLNRDIGASYIIDDSIVRINLKGTDLILGIKDENTLIGKGVLADGLYKKVNE